MQQLLCENCYEIDPPNEHYLDGTRQCMLCGGKVLTIQEAADRIAELKSRLREDDNEYPE